jgi:hypothetical protein
MRLSAIIVSAALSCGISLVACSGDDDLAPQSAVGRSFDELARAVASCAEVLNQCTDDDAGAGDGQSCRTEFTACRTDTGKSAEDDLADAIGACQEHANVCRADASTDAQEERCTATLRSCIGEARAAASDDSSRDAGAPNPDAPTYQCFGQLRECIAGETAPKQCAAEARACVIAAVGEPPAIHRPRVVPPIDAGVRPPEAGRSGSGAAGASGAAGSRGDVAGASGAAGSHDPAGAGGTGDAGGATDDVARACMAERDACLMRGEKPMTCDRDERKCTKAKP